ncbi:MAG: hypothetical protein Q7R52_04235 [archaeon]|nr:hypothetical protein [archaeon]
MEKRNYQRREEVFLVSPILASTGHSFSRMKEDSETITDLGNPCVEVPEGTPQVVYDEGRNPYLLIVGDNLKKAKRVAEDLGFTLGREFIRTNFKGLGEVLGYCYSY